MAGKYEWVTKDGKYRITRSSAGGWIVVHHPNSATTTTEISLSNASVPVGLGEVQKFVYGSSVGYIVCGSSKAPTKPPTPRPVTPRPTQPPTKPPCNCNKVDATILIENVSDEWTWRKQILIFLRIAKDCKFFSETFLKCFHSTSNSENFPNVFGQSKLVLLILKNKLDFGTHFRLAVIVYDCRVKIWNGLTCIPEGNTTSGKLEREKKIKKLFDHLLNLKRPSEKDQCYQNGNFSHFRLIFQHVFSNFISVDDGEKGFKWCSNWAFPLHF